MKKITTVLLILTMIFTTVGASFANEVDNFNTNLITLENGQQITEQELIEFLNSYDGEIIKISDDTIYPSENLRNDETMPRAAAAVAIPAWAIGKWVIPFIGTVVITPVAIYVGDKLIEAGTSLYNNIIEAVDNIVFAKKNPTGRKVKDVHKRLKKEGFEKVGQTGSHEKWKKGNKRVTVPNHGSNSEIPIGTLRNIWKQAGWI